MSPAHLHLILNHFPLIGFVFSILVLAVGLWRANQDFLRAGFLIIVVSGLFAIPTFLTGEPAEDMLEKSPGFSKELVEEHEKAADFALTFVEITAVAALASLVLSIKKGRAPKALVIATTVLNIFTLTVIARTNYLGGQISHPEIRSPEKPS